MQVIYALERLPHTMQNGWFLAGPTPRRMQTVPSWRPKALQILETLSFAGTVMVPEPRDGQMKNHYHEQMSWELEGLTKASRILFWVPRDLQELPGFTTNVEFGYWIHSGKVVLGFPRLAPKMRYLHLLAQKHQVPVYHELETMLREQIPRENGME